MIKRRKLKKHLKNVLAEHTPSNELGRVHNSYDIVGNIAILRLTDSSKEHGKKIAETIMGIHKNVKTVLVQTSPVFGNLRLRNFEHLAGENKTFTVHKESECIFSVDVRDCYFSPRLLYERIRIAKQVKNKEIIVNMFAGVGCFSLVIAKNSCIEKIYSIDVNPAAIQHLERNIRLNRVYGKVVPILGDAKNIIETKLRHVADRVLMPLPEKAFECLPCALLALKSSGGWIHYYDFEHAKRGEDPIAKIKLKVADRLRCMGVSFEILSSRVVRSTGPNWYQIVLDIQVKGKG